MRLPVASNLLRQCMHIGQARDLQLTFWLLLALGCGFLASVARLHGITHDAFHEMALFREALVLGSFPIDDVFAYTPTVNPTVHHEWATGALLYFTTVGSGLGLLGLTVTRLLLIAAIWLLVYRVARMRGAHPYIFALLSFLAFPVFWVGFSTLRAQLFTLLFIAAQLWMQELDWRGRKAWVLLWLAMLVAWLNIHAGFVVGLGMMSFHGAERFLGTLLKQRSVRSAFAETWHLFLAAPAAAALLLVNPYGWQYVPYLIRAISMERPLIREWLPLWHTYAPVVTLVVFTISVGLFVYAQRVTKLSKLRGSAFLALCIYMTIKHIRHGSIFGVVWLAYVPAWISRSELGKWIVLQFTKQRWMSIRTCQIFATVCLGFAVVNQFWLPRLPAQRQYATSCYPVGAVDYLAKHDFEGNLWTPFYAGSYVSWKLYPEVKVSFDGRYEVAYQPQIMPEHNQFRDAQGEWWKLLDKYDTDAILIHRLSPVANQVPKICGLDTDDLITTQKDWSIAYQDDAFILLADRKLVLPYEDYRGQQFSNRGAWEAFAQRHGHWSRGRRTSPTIASAQSSR